MMNKETAKNQLEQLLSKYSQLNPSEIKKYNEAMTKQGFILPLFQCLQWDIFNTDEVVPEEKVSKGWVDYAFKLHGVSQFYLEVKPLKADLSKPEYKTQVVTYAYNKGVTWAVLTDFEGIQVYNAQTGRSFITLSHENYMKEFDKLWLLSRDSLRQGLLNKEAAAYGALPPLVNIESRLYDHLRNSREKLFTQLYQYNRGLTFEQIDEIIQRFFNRLIFIRTCEDRGIEEKVILSIINQWKTGDHKGELIEEIRKIFSKFDGYYDSDLFALHLVDQTYVEGPTIENIINGLYIVPGGLANYDFSIIDADVLGAVYEQYLGHVANTVKQRARRAQARAALGLPSEVIELELKKEKQKGSGIFYTPKYVTDYIVKNTVRRLISDKGIDNVANIKILDPACGSGSFLIRAFDELLTYNARINNKDVSDLDQSERLPLLHRNIFGVDLDNQAVEISRLNLLLRSLAKREILPSLRDNIQQGNSLVSGSERELNSYFGKAWKDKKPFDWKTKYPEILKGGGFDVIIGNPPWVSIKGKHKSLDLPSEEIRYLIDKLHVNSYAPNLYEAFIWRSLDLLKENGFFSFIVPDRLAANQQFVRLREYILKNLTLEKLWFRVPFPGIIADTLVFVISNKKPQNNNIEICDYPTQKTITVPQDMFLSSSDFAWFFIDPDIAKIFRRIRRSRKVDNLEVFAKSTSGCGAKSTSLHEKRVSKREIRVLKGENIGQYRSNGFFWLNFKDENLTGRTRDIKKLGAKEKVLIRKTGADIIATFDDSGIYPEQSLYFLYDTDRETLLYLLAILNSKLMNIYYRNFAITNRDATPQLKNIDLDRFPIRTPSGEEKSRLVKLAEKTLALNVELQSTVPHTSKWDSLKSELVETRKYIDVEIFNLYGLNAREKKIIELASQHN